MSIGQRLLLSGLIVIALGLLYPGVTQPVLTLSGTIEKSELTQLGIDMVVGEQGDPRSRQFLTSITGLLGLDEIEGQLQVYSNTRSIWGTVQALADSGNALVAFLVVFFSVVIPVFKLLLQGLVLVLPRADWRRGILWVNSALSKWSMADVFVLALLIAFLAGRASEQMGDLLMMDAQLEVGFYYFLGYCLFSIAAALLLQRAQPGLSR